MPPGYLAELVRRAGPLAPGEVYIADVAHDSGCRRPHGGPCTCRPDITIRRVPENGPPEAI
jgi:hypothetical protein